MSYDNWKLATPPEYGEDDLDPRAAENYEDDTRDHIDERQAAAAKKIPSAAVAA